eukprot:18636-Heterococcus_DN1.PRE.4
MECVCTVLQRSAAACSGSTSSNSSFSDAAAAAAAMQSYCWGVGCRGEMAHVFLFLAHKNRPVAVSSDSVIAAQRATV